MLINKISTLRSEDAAIILPLLNSPSTGNEQNPTMDTIYPQIIHLSRENYHRVKENGGGSIVAAMSAAQKGLLGGPPFIVKSVMLATVKIVQVEERIRTA
eukprot:7662199-Ditylum_brightwellii.AAC.1